MKRVLAIVGIVIVGGALVWALQGQEQQKQPAAPAAQATASKATASTQPEKVAFTFTDDAQMKQFAQVWGQRQGVLTRMAVLQAYWNQEQAGLTQLNQELLSKYNLDVSKNYTLDTTKKALVEQPLTPEQIEAAAKAATAATPGQASQPGASANQQQTSQSSTQPPANP